MTTVNRSATTALWPQPILSRALRLFHFVVRRWTAEVVVQKKLPYSSLSFPGSFVSSISTAQQGLVQGAMMRSAQHAIADRDQLRQRSPTNARGQTANVAAIHDESRLL